MDQILMAKSLVPLSIVIFGAMFLAGCMILASSIKSSSETVALSIVNASQKDVSIPKELTLILKGPGSTFNDEIEVKLTK